MQDIATMVQAAAATSKTKEMNMANEYIADPYRLGYSHAEHKMKEQLAALEKAQTHWQREIERTVRQDESRIADLVARVAQLEKLVQYPNSMLTTSANLRSEAAQQQATEHLYAPLRSDTRAVVDLAAFARRLIDMQDLGHAVTDEVRELAKRALGLK